MINKKDIQTLFGKVVREERVNQGLTQSELAERSDLDNTYISQIERGLANPSIFSLYKISDSLNITESELFHRMNTPLASKAIEVSGEMEELELIYNAVVRLDASLLLTMTHDEEYRIIYCNDRFSAFINSKKEDKIGKKLIDILNDGKNNGKVLDFLEQLKGDASKSELITRSDGKGNEVQLEINASSVLNGHDDVGQHLLILKKRYFDVKKSTLDKTVNNYKVLLNETNHRIKNNLSIIIGIIDITTMNIEDKYARSILRDTQLRISSVAHIHELLINAEDHTKLGIKDYLNSLTSVIANTYEYKRGVELTTNIEVQDLGINQVITIGLLSNELITNSYKYAFPTQSNGQIRLELTKNTGDNLLFNYEDDGTALGSINPFLRNQNLLE